MGTPKLKELEVPSPGPDQESFYEKDIGMGEKCIPAGQVPDTGDYVDDDVSKPDGVLFEGPQSWSSDKLHGGDGLK